MRDAPTISLADDTQGRPVALRFRLGTPADFARCVELLPPGFRAEGSIRQRLIDLWGQLLAGEARTFAVIEDLERRREASIAGFGLSVFVSDRFVDEFWASPRPYISALFYERMLAGGDVGLSPEQLTDANASGGINVLGLHFGMSNHDLSDPRSAQVLSAGSSAFHFFHAGYRLRTVLNEVYGANAAAYMTAGGFRLVHDFQRLAPTVFADVPAEHYPYLFMLHREWIVPAAVNTMAQLFFAPNPRIFFSASERRVLERALLNYSDAHTAQCLGVSDDGIKKTWRRIHERVELHAPFLLPETSRMPCGSRGQEKRRHLLEYLRTHLEELRPARPAPSQRSDQT